MLFIVNHFVSCIVIIVLVKSSSGKNLTMYHQNHEIILVDDNFHPRQIYHLEDFFWTGSGDGINEDDIVNKSTNDPSRTTIYHTTTIYDTSTKNNMDGTENTTNCVFECLFTSPLPNNSITTIQPTPTLNVSNNSYQIPDRKYWLLTILEKVSFPNKESGNLANLTTSVPDLEYKLATLYHIAFYRQQQRHLGINHSNKRKKRSYKNTTFWEENTRRKTFYRFQRSTNVNVKIHNITEREDEIGLLYSVRVGKQPVLAKTAAEDMKLVNDTEMENLLGYIIRTKSEPYLREPSTTQSLIQTSNIWIFIGSSSIIILIIILVLLLMITTMKKRKLKAKLLSANLEKKVGATNLAFQTEETGVQTVSRIPSIATINTRPGIRRLKPIRISSSSSSESSLSGSPKVSPLWPDHNIDLSNGIIVDAKNNVSIGTKTKNGILSAASYLSMPSIRAFPRSSIPEPLSKVLETSRNSSAQLFEKSSREDDISPRDEKKIKRPLTRHKSIEGEDPGVIGPIVWNQHLKRLHENDEINNPLKSSNVKKRFQELLDDTFSLFSSRNPTPGVDRNHSPFQGTSSGAHSPLSRLSGNEKNKFQRPRTSVPVQRKFQSGPALTITDTLPDLQEPHSLTYGSVAPLIRPLSAGPFHRPAIDMPQISVTRVLSDAKLSIDDPARKVIDNIKKQLEDIETN